VQVIEAHMFSEKLACLVLGAWCLVLGAWCLVLGAWCSRMG
jgi:hypothetical protein